MRYDVYKYGFPAFRRMRTHPVETTNAISAVEEACALNRVKISPNDKFWVVSLDDGEAFPLTFTLEAKFR